MLSWQLAVNRRDLRFVRGDLKSQGPVGQRGVGENLGQENLGQVGLQFTILAAAAGGVIRLDCSNRQVTH